MTKKQAEKSENEEKCKNRTYLAAAVVKGKIYFYCLKEIWNSHTKFGRSKKSKVLTLYCVRGSFLRIYAL